MAMQSRGLRRGLGLLVCLGALLRVESFAPPRPSCARRRPAPLSYRLSAAAEEPRSEERQGYSVDSEALRRAKASDSYGIWEMIITPERSDIVVAGVPPELQGLATELLQSLPISRKARLSALEALVVAYRAHQSAAADSVSSGGPTLTEVMEKSVAVAKTLAECRVDYHTIVAALLCKAPVSPSEVSEEFGQAAQILQGYHRLSGMEEVAEVKALLKEYPRRLLGLEGENMRSMMLALAGDWRSIALRVAWMRIDIEGPFSSEKERRNLMLACMAVFAPLAERAGMKLIQDALQESAFKELMPEEHKRISTQLREREEYDLAVLRQAQKEVRQALLEDEVFMASAADFSLAARLKSPYSVWKKLQKDGGKLDDLFDIVALRVVVTPQEGVSGEELCKYVLSVVHKLRPHYTNRVKDYISSPKPNGYQSLHTTLQMRLAGRPCPFEVQVRTTEMHRVAEFGLASHAIYKGDTNLGKLMQNSRAPPPQELSSAGDLLSWVQRVLAESQVFVLGPDGKLLNFSRGTTLSDLLKTYTLTRNLSKGVWKSLRVNGKRAYPGRILNTGDVVAF